MWVKICGNTNLDDARHAAEAGADALGFVFAPSPRRVTLEEVRRMVPFLPAGVETYGIFVDASAEEIVRTVLECNLSGVQLHGVAESGTGLRLVETLRRHFLARHAERTKIVAVLKCEVQSFDEDLGAQLEAAAGSADAVLVDSRSAGRAGGTGKRWDWAAGSATLRGAFGKVRVIAAGGLDPMNVGEAVQTLSPWGVDVVTGVEAAPGRKDWKRVEAFIASAKEARLAAAVQ
jgi:phosphoribosylanthranilate isomerase